MQGIITMVLAGGHGSRLTPLTSSRAKPAVPFGGKFRVIDFTLTNCLHSGLRRVLVLSQYKSLSLQKHLRDGWSIFNPELGEYITMVPPQMNTGERWYSGTADAVYQNLYLLERSGAKHVVILSGDHIYRMDYAPMIAEHIERNATATVATMRVPLEDGQRFGVVSVDGERRVTGFAEKPANPTPLPDDSSQCLASMGIYVFRIDALMELLKADAERSDSKHDFGYDIIPGIIDTETVIAYGFGGKPGRVTQDNYWRDVGTLDQYYQANMDLLEPIPRLDLYQPDWPIRTYHAQYPPMRTVPGVSGTEGILINSIASAGVVISGGQVQHSILSPEVFVDDEASVFDAILFRRCKIGKGSQVQRCIIENDVQIPPNTQIGFDLEADAKRFTVTPNGIVVVPKGYNFQA